MVYGYCTSEAVDSQGEIVTKKAIRKAWEDYMEFANVREMHQPSAVGVTKEFQHDDNGTWIGVKVVDDRAWKFVKEGVYKGFSIGGRVVKKSKNIIEEIILAEISLVDRPANPDAKFTAVKVDGGLVDQFHLEVINNKNIMNKFIEIDGVKYVEDETNPGSPKVDENGEKVLFVEEPAPEADPAPADPAPEADPAPSDPVEETPADPAPADPAPEADPVDGEKKDGAVDVKKDTMGVITLASALDHLAYIKSMFEMNGKATEGIQSIMDTCKSMIAEEASEADKAHKVEDLQKAFETTMAPVKAMLEGFTKDITGKFENLQKEVEGIKSKRVSPRPQGSAAVEKTFENNDTSKSSLAEKRKAVDDIAKEIDEFSMKMKDEVANNPSASTAMLKQADELYKKFRDAQRELNDSITLGE